MVHFTYPLYLTALLLISSSSSADVHKTAITEKEVFKARRPIVLLAKRFPQAAHYSNAFIDKSLLIKELLESPRRIHIITCPRNWGKTWNLRMLQYFLQPQVTACGDRYENRSETFNYLLFVRGESVFHSDILTTVEKLKKPMLISQHTDIVDTYLGKFPTIYLNFKDLNQTTNELIFSVIKSKISDAFREHYYMVHVLNRTANDSNIPNEQRVEAQRSLDTFLTILRCEGDKIDLIESVAFLSKVLYKHFQGLVFVLLDNWDGILHNTLFNTQQDTATLHEVVDFFSSFFETSIKKNAYLNKAFLAGTHMVKSLVHELELIHEYRIIFNDLNEYFGFSETEVTDLLDSFGFDRTVRPRVKEWFNGFRAGVNASVSIYNPKFIANYLGKKIFAVFGHTDYELNRILRDTLRYAQFRNIIVSLIVEKPAFLYPKHLMMDKTGLPHFKEVLSLKKISQAKISHFSIQHILAFLCGRGYLTFEEGSYMLMQTPYQLNIRIPNDAARGRIMNRFMVFIESNFGLLPRSKHIDKCAQYLIKYVYSFEENTVEPLCEELLKIVKQVPYFKYNEESKNKMYNEEFANVLLHFISERILKLYPLKIDKPFRYKQPILALYPFVSDFKAILTIAVNATSDEDCLRLIKSNKNYFSFPNNIKTIKYVGINIQSKNNVTVYSKFEHINGYVPPSVTAKGAVNVEPQVPKNNEAQLPENDEPADEGSDADYDVAP